MPSETHVSDGICVKRWKSLNVWVDNLYSDSDYSDDVMQTIFKDGKLLVEDNFQTLRERAVEDIREH
ncbi:hypothetical protein [Neisseria basseii]|uniref:hypothetical protein n=1 Tax=Neisseria basseii TaxID=2830650 RepID=UPI0026592D05|nr:hypothetical protein [Neisseria basseii]